MVHGSCIPLNAIYWESIFTTLSAISNTNRSISIVQNLKQYHINISEINRIDPIKPFRMEGFRCLLDHTKAQGNRLSI